MTAQAVVDIGSNAARLLVADRGEPVLRRSRITGLAERLGATGMLSTAALARLATVLEDYRRDLDERGATLARVVGTAAARTAGNADELAGLVADVLGRPLEVLSADEEARLTFLGAVGSDARGRRLVVDIGGGSTELVVGEAVPEGVASLDLGSAALTAAELPVGPAPARGALQRDRAGPGARGRGAACAARGRRVDAGDRDRRDDHDHRRGGDRPAAAGRGSRPGRRP